MQTFLAAGAQEKHTSSGTAGGLLGKKGKRVGNSSTSFAAWAAGEQEAREGEGGRGAGAGSRKLALAVALPSVSPRAFRAFCFISRFPLLIVSYRMLGCGPTDHFRPFVSFPAFL